MSIDDYTATNLLELLSQPEVAGPGGIILSIHVH